MWGDSTPLMLRARISYCDIPVIVVSSTLIGLKVFKIYNLRLLEKSFIYICHLKVLIHTRTVYFTDETSVSKLARRKRNVYRH
jgi:hypothetical protein